MYFLIARFFNRKSSEAVIARSDKKEDTEIKQLLIYYRDKCGFDSDYIKLYIKQV